MTVLAHPENKVLEYFLQKILVSAKSWYTNLSHVQSFMMPTSHEEKSP